MIYKIFKIIPYKIYFVLTLQNIYCIIMHGHAMRLSPIFSFAFGNIFHNKYVRNNIIDTFVYKINGDKSIYDIIYVITRTRRKVP